MTAIQCPNCGSESIVMIQHWKKKQGNIIHEYSMFRCLKCGCCFSYARTETIETNPNPEDIWSVS